MSNWRNDAYHAQQDAERAWIEESAAEAEAQADMPDAADKNKIVVTPPGAVELSAIVDWMNAANYRSHRIKDAANHFNVSKSSLGMMLWRYGYVHENGRWLDTNRKEG